MRWRLYTLFRRLRQRFFPPKPLLKKEEHLKLLDKARRLELIRDGLAKSLKCGPEEIGDKVNKILAHIEEMKDFLRKQHVGRLIETTHKNCKKHDGPNCKCYEKCLDNECDYCQSVDWLRNDLGLESLLNKNKH